MKKNLKIICLCIASLFLNTSGVFASTDQAVKSSRLINDCNSQELYVDLLKSLLSPYILDAIAKYYPSDEVTSFSGNDMRFLDIKRLENLGQYYFEFIVEIHTFQGPHNPPYATDIITFRKDFSGIHVIDYKHHPEK